jgi:DNA-binding HxlR family transcriptional regulator
VKGRRTDLSQTSCAASRALEIIGDWWSLLIVRDALVGVQRFNEFQKNIGLAKNILSSRLKKLVDGGVLRVEPDGDSSRQRYVLTEKGRDLGVVVTAVWQWGETHCFTGEDPAPLLIDTVTGQPLAPLQLRTADDQTIDPQALRMGLVVRNASPVG